MNVLAWLLGMWGLQLVSNSVAARLGATPVPDWGVLMLVFLTPRRSPLWIMLLALTWGYLCGQEAGAPVGVYELALTTSAFLVYLLSGSLAAEGHFFYATASTGMWVLLQFILAVLKSLSLGTVNFSILLTSNMFFGSFGVFCFAALLYPLFVWFENRFVQNDREGLLWR